MNQGKRTARGLMMASLMMIIHLPALDAQLSFSAQRQRDKALNQGIAHVLAREYEDAVIRFSECIEIDPNCAKAYFERGRVFIEWGALKDAEEDIDKALDLNPTMGEACFYKGYLLFGGDSTGTDALFFTRAMENGFQHPWADYYLGLIHIRENENDMALKHFSSAIAQKEDFALAYHERAGVKRTAGDLQGALNDYRIAIGYQPDFPLAFNNMGSVKILLGDYDGALEDYSSAIQLDSGFILALNNRGYARYFLGDLEGALADFEAAIALGFPYSDALSNKAAVLAGQDRLEPALSLIDEAIGRYPDEAVLFLNRGLVREMLGDLEGACDDWHRAQDLGAEEATVFLKECR